MPVFISHSSKDKPAVEALALALHGRGIEAWYDKWMIGPGDDIVAKINEGLEQAGAGLIVFSAHSRENRWVEAEVSYLTYARIKEGKVLIPVLAGPDAYVPPLLRPLAWCGIDQVDAIADALLHRRAGPPPVASAATGRREQVLVSLRRDGASGVRVRVLVGTEEYGSETHPALPRAVAAARDAFLAGPRAGARHTLDESSRASIEAEMAGLGRILGDFCLPGGAGEALANLAMGCDVGTVVEVGFEADDPELLGLPFEALRLPDNSLLATLPTVVTLRRPVGIAAKERPRLAGPIKILIAVGAPDEGYTGSAVLDHERELQNILDAVEPAQRNENVEVRILEVGHPKVIAAAIERDAYHVLHLSCHGGPGQLELEDEDGKAVPTTAKDLIEPIRRHGRPLPLVFLSACHGGVQKEQTASFSESLLRAGVPCVVAMQTSVSDHYATQLARSFYEHLARREPPLVSRALAEARKEVEQARLQAVQHGAPLAQTQPEYATASLYVARDEEPLADFSLDKEPLRERPVYHVAGPVPQLRIDDLIGRRRELRDTLRTLRDRTRRHAGVVLTGLGGVGKSAVAGRVMQRLEEDGRLVAAHAGRFDLRAIAASLGTALLESGRGELRKRADLLLSANLDDGARFQFLSKTLAEDPVVLVLDDFEQNLSVGGGAFLDPDVSLFVGMLARNASRGRLLLTCRYPVPGLEADLREVSIGPLSPAEARKLVQRLPRLKERAPAEIAQVLHVIGGHPRILEFLDGLLHGGEGRLPHVTRKLRETLDAAGIDPKDSAASLDDRLQQAVLLGMRNVLLQELVEIARGHSDADLLFQAAVSNLPTSPAGLAHMLADGPADAAPVERAVARLADLSLLYRFPDGSAWVHRWTAEGLARIDDPTAHAERCNRAGRYRIWRAEHESHDLGDGIEAVRDFLAGRDFDAAVEVALGCVDALRRFQQSVGIAALASEVLETLPVDHANYAPVADEEAQAHLTLGLTGRALERYQSLLDVIERRARAEPDRADYQRDLAAFHQRMGILYRGLGQGEAARDAHLKALAIIERLAQAEPDRADYQFFLGGCYERMGDLSRALGQGEAARDAHLKALRIRERLVEAEPDRLDYQRDLSVSYERMGDLSRALGQGELARDAYRNSLTIRERLARAEPDSADYQRGLSVSYNKMGDLSRALGQGEAARDAYLKALAIRERLARAEPDRADYQRGLGSTYDRMGDLHSALGQGEEARDYYLKALAIAERLTRAEPDRADYRRDLSVSYNKMGDLSRALGQGELARDAYRNSLAIAERLARAEPDRADYQVDLAISLTRTGVAGDSIAPEPIERAIAILLTLQKEGRLSPADEPKIAEFRELLRAGMSGSEPSPPFLTSDAQQRHAAADAKRRISREKSLSHHGTR
jgi:tetratricopeptide (TPR) repeat protein